MNNNLKGKVGIQAKRPIEQYDGGYLHNKTQSLIQIWIHG